MAIRTFSVPANSDELFVLLVTRHIEPIFRRNGYSIRGLEPHPIMDDPVEFSFKMYGNFSPSIIVAKDRSLEQGRDLLRCAFTFWKRGFILATPAHFQYTERCALKGVPQLEHFSLEEQHIESTILKFADHLEAHLSTLLKP